jgi:hypothetical protein
LLLAVGVGVVQKIQLVVMVLAVAVQGDLEQAQVYLLPQELLIQ